MKRLIAVLIFITPMLCNGQESTDKQGRFSIGVNFSPNYSYRVLNYSDEWQSTVDSREEYEQGSFGFNTGVVAHYSFLERLEVELGVQYSRQAHMFTDVPLYDFIEDRILGKADTQFRYHYIEIPLRVNYHFMVKKVFGYITAGISVNTFLNDESKTWVTYDNGETEVVTGETSIADFNEVAFGIIGGAGIAYKVTNRFDIRLEPLFRYSLTPLAEAPIDQHNYSIGCQVGISMRL
jgi:hypothetical protein